MSPPADLASPGSPAVPGPAEGVDVHCHCLPGMDDGPADLGASLELCRRLVADGFTTVIATPHQLGPYGLRNTGATVAAAARVLREHLREAGVPLSVVPGGDVRVDERLLDLVRDGTVSGLGPTGRHVLLELPDDAVFDLRGVARQLRDIGRGAILSHPERHLVLGRRPEVLVPWVHAGVALQVTAASLLGGFGPVAGAAAWRLIDLGLVALVATDAHDATRRPPLMTAARERIANRHGPAAARLMCLENPLAVLRGDAVLTPAIDRPTGLA